MSTVATRLKGLLCRSHDLLDANVPDSHQILDGRDINANEDTIVRDRLRPGILLASMAKSPYSSGIRDAGHPVTECLWTFITLVRGFLQFY
jgi:hypothetical protein